MIHTRTKIIALVSLAVFVVALLIHVGFFLVLEKHKEELAAERLRAAEAELQSNALSALEVTVISSKEDREKLRGYILGDEEIIDLLSMIELTAREQGVTLTTDSLTVGPLDGMFEQLQVAVSLEGSFDGVMRMLRILENLPKQSFVPRVTLTKLEGVGVNTMWQGSVDIHVTKYKKI